MKPVFGVDITVNKKNEESNCKAFVTNTVSEPEAKSLETRQERLDETLQQSKLPLWMRIVEYVCGFFAAIVLVGILKALGEVSLEQGFQNAPGLFIVGGVCALIWGVLFLLAKKKEKGVMTVRNADRQMDELARNIQSVYRDLGVPEDAVSVDVLAFRYKNKNGEPVPTTVGLQLAAYINLDLKLYAEADTLFIADLEHVYSFPLSEIKAIKTVNKRIPMSSWNKEIGPDKGIYKPYKLTVNNMGNIFCKPYHILELVHEGETYGIYFPCYELAHFEALTGLKATE